MYIPYIGFGNPNALLPYCPERGVSAMLERAVEEHLVGRVKAAGSLLSRSGVESDFLSSQNSH